MSIIPTPTLPIDGSDADVGDYNPIIIAILAVLNGHVDGDNIEPGSLNWSHMDSFTDSIPAEAMEDEGNLVKYRSEILPSGFVASGMEWSVSSGFDAGMSAGVLYTKTGLRIDVPAVATRTFTASKDTYISVGPNGTLSYEEVANGAAPTALGTNAIFIAMVNATVGAIQMIHKMAPRNPGEVARFTAGGSLDTIILPFIPNFSQYNIDYRILNFATNGLQLKFRYNGDTGSNYAQVRSTDFGAAVTDVSQTQLSMQDSDEGHRLFGHMRIMNLASQEKLTHVTNVQRGINGAAAAPRSRQLYGKWANTTDVINRIDFINAGAGDFLVDTEIVVRASR